MGNYLKTIVSILVILGACFSTYFYINTTYASKSFVLSGFQEFQRDMELGRLLAQRDSLSQLELNIRWHLYAHPNDQGAIQHLNEVKRQIDCINTRIQQLMR